MAQDVLFTDCRLVRKLSRGKFGSLSLLHSDDGSFLRRTIHRLTSEEDHWRRLKLLQLGHKNLQEIVQIIVDVTDITVYSVHHSDVSLLDIVRGYFEPSIEEQQILTWLCRILDGLQYLHDSGLQHGNLTAKSVLIASNRLWISDWCLSPFVSSSDRTDLESVGSILLVVISLNSAVDGQTLRSETITQLLESRRHSCSEFLLNITSDLLTNRMESLEYLRGLIAAPYDHLCDSNQSLNLFDDAQSQVDASPVHRKQRAQILQALAREAGGTTPGAGVKHPSIILTFFNLFKLSVKRWKRSLFKATSLKKAKHPKLERSVSCPAAICLENRVELTG